MIYRSFADVRKWLTNYDDLTQKQIKPFVVCSSPSSTTAWWVLDEGTHTRSWLIETATWVMDDFLCISYISFHFYTGLHVTTFEIVATLACAYILCNWCTMLMCKKLIIIIIVLFFISHMIGLATPPVNARPLPLWIFIKSDSFWLSQYFPFPDRSI